MVVKFWANKGLSAIDYLLNNRVEEGTSRVMSGNEMLTRRIIENMTQKNKATVGVLSFHKNDRLNEAQKKEIMDSFETAIFSGVPKDETNILWVEHTDKDRLELNFVIPKVNLVTQRSVNWSFDKLDRDFFNSWRNLINHQYNLEKPNDPTKKRNFKHSKNLKINTMYEEINSTLYEMIVDGSIRSRYELVNVLKQAGFEIHRMGKDYISIQSKEMKKPKRFKGGIYAECFREPQAITTAIQEYEKTRISGVKKGSSTSSQDRLEQEYNRLQRSRKQRFVQARAGIERDTEPSGNTKSIYKIFNSNIERAERKRRENREIRAKNRNTEQEQERGDTRTIDNNSRINSDNSVGNILLKENKPKVSKPIQQNRPKPRF